VIRLNRRPQKRIEGVSTPEESTLRRGGRRYGERGIK
jgi:hypothetical protein